MESLRKNAPYTDEVFRRSGAIPPEEGERWRGEWEQWTHDVLAFAKALDVLHVTAPAKPETRILNLAFSALLPLVDPEWWRAHPPVELTELEREQLSECRSERERVRSWSDDGWRFMTVTLFNANEMFIRVRDLQGLLGCIPVIDAMLEGAEEHAPQPPAGDRLAAGE